MNRIVIFLKGLVMFALPLILGGCPLTPTPPPPTKTPFVLIDLPSGTVELPFETVVRASDSFYEDKQPEVMVIANQDQVRDLSVTLWPELLSEVSTVDFSNYFVVVAFHGFRPDGCCHIEVKQLVRQDKQVDVYAYFTEKPPGAPRTAATISPFHAVKVRKEGSWGDEFTFVLYDNSRPVAETKHYIP